MFYGPSSLFYGFSFFIFEEPKYALHLISGPVVDVNLNMFFMMANGSKNGPLLFNKFFASPK